MTPVCQCCGADLEPDAPASYCDNCFETLEALTARIHDLTSGWEAANKQHKDLIEKMAGALDTAAAFFVARDEMNAHVHLAPIRLSPITVEVQEALEAWRAYAYPTS